MIYISRPVAESHKVVEKLSDKSLNNDLREKKSMEPIKKEGEEDFEKNFNREDLEGAVKTTNKMILHDDNRFEFKVHERTKRMMVKLINKETNETIKEFPPEKILDLVASIWDLVGILVDERG